MYFIFSSFYLILVLLLPIYPVLSTNVDDCNSLELNNSGIAINVMASRDTGPVTRMDGSGLIISINIYSVDRQQLPEIIEPTDAKAYYEMESWNMDSSNDIGMSRYFDGTGFRFKYRQGPLWPVDSEIEVKFNLQINDLSCSFEQQLIPIVNNK